MAYSVERRDGTCCFRLVCVHGCLQDLFYIFADPSLLGRPRAGYIEPANRMRCEECGQSPGRFRNRGRQAYRRSRHLVARQVKTVLAQPLGDLKRQPGAADGLARDAEDDRRIAVANVPLGSLRIPACGRFPKLVSCCDRAVFGEPSTRTPALVGNAMFDREIQRRAIGTRLSARNNCDRSPVHQEVPLGNLFSRPAVLNPVSMATADRMADSTADQLTCTCC